MNGLTSSIRTTNNELKRCYSVFIWLYEPYTMLKYEEPFCHTIGKYGKNYDVFRVPNDRWQGTVILHGDRSGGMKTKSNSKLEEQFNNAVNDFLSMNIISDDSRKQFVRDMLVAFVTGINTKCNDFNKLTAEIQKKYGSFNK